MATLGKVDGRDNTLFQNSVGDRYRTPGGWTAEVVQIAVGERLRIRHHGYYIADATARRSPDAA